MAWNTVSICVLIEIRGHQVLRRASSPRDSAPVDQLVRRLEATTTRGRVGVMADCHVVREGQSGRKRPLRRRPARAGCALSRCFVDALEPRVGRFIAPGLGTSTRTVKDAHRARARGTHAQRAICFKGPRRGPHPPRDRHDSDSTRQHGKSRRSTGNQPRRVTGAPSV